MTIFDEQLQIFKIRETLVTRALRDYMKLDKTNVTITICKSQEFGEEHMRGWWREKDFSAVLKEQLITCEMDANSIVAKVYADLLKEE